MPELGPLGTVRGAFSNGRPYRERNKNLRHRILFASCVMWRSERLLPT